MSRPLALALALALSSLVASPARAQDDWAIARDPFDKKVVAQYKRLLEKNPSDKDALAKLTRLYRKHRTLAQLAAEYGKELEAEPTRFSALVVLGHLQLGEGKRDEALGYYERAVAARPGDGGVLIALGGLYRQVGKTAEARAALERALPLSRDAAQKKELLRSLADLAAATGDLAAARKHFDAYFALDPGDVAARLELGDALSRAKQWDEAITIFRAAEDKLKRDPARRVEVVARIGQTLEGAGKDDAAIAEYDRAMAMVKRGYYLRKELTERVIEIHRRKQTLPALITRYDKAWPAAGRDHFEWDVLARLYEETGLQDKAVAAFEKAVARAPYELDTQRRLIALLENSGDEAAALARYEAVIRVAPGEPRFQLELAERYWKRHDEKRSLALLKQLEARFAGDAGVQAALADLYTRWGKDELALAAHQRLTQIEPSESSHLVNLGEQYFQKGDKKKALATWKRIADDRRPESQAKLAEVYAEHDMLPEALDLFGKAIKARPKAPELYKGRAAVHERQKSFDAAVADWEKLLELSPPSKATRPARREARRQIVNLLKRAGGVKLSQRTSSWERGFGKKPPDVEAGYFLVEADLRSGNTRRARIVLEKLIALDGDDLDSMDQLVKAYESERLYDQAVALLEQILTRSPGRERELYNRIAAIKTLQHQDDEAIRYAQKALDKSPNDALAHQQLAERYLEMQKYDLAIAAFEKAIAIDPRSFRSYFELARLYRNKHALADAARLYHEVLKRATDDEILVKAGREAVALEELTGTLGELEKLIAPLSFTYAHKPVFRRILVELYERQVPALLAQRRRGAQARAAADKALAELGAHGLKPLLEALGDDDDPVQQRIAVAVLGHLGNRGAAAPLVRLATQPEAADRRRIGTLTPTLDWDVRVEALVAAGRLGDPRIIPDLVALTGHAEVAMREGAVFAMGVTGDRRATAPLIAAIDDRRDSVQTLACLGLGRTRDDKALAAASKVVVDEARSDATRAACAFALGALGDRRAVAALSSALGSGNGETQRLAAWALGRLGDPHALPGLLTAYFAKRDGVRDAVAWALPRVAAGTPSQDPVDFGSDYPLRAGKFDQRTAIAALAASLDPPPLSPALIVGQDKALIAGLEDALRRHRDMVLRVLADLDARPAGLALGPLTVGLDRAAPADRKPIEAALERIGAALSDDLVALGSHGDPAVRQRGLAILAKIGGTEARAAVVRGLDDSELAVRQAAIEAAAALIARKADAELAATVASRLEAPSWQERVTTADALARLGASADADALARALASDDKAFVRAAAARALGRLRARAGLAALIRAASADREPMVDVRLAAVEALSGLGDPAARRALDGVAKADPEPAVRAAAIRKK